MLIILGPTATGKSKLAVEIAKKMGAEIVSADSMQVYRGMDIGTAKPTLKERQGIPHHLIDIRDPDEPWTVSDFIEQANQLISKITKRIKKTIIVGGTGLYLWALLEGFSFPIVEADPSLRKRLEKEPLDKLYAKLQKVDPKASKKIHSNDKKRIVRALEVYELTGERISELHKEKKSSFVPDVRRDHSSFSLIGLTLPRDELYKRINQRVDQMIEKGLTEEVKALLAKGYNKNLPSMQALGYKEAIKLFEGRWTMDEMANELKKRTRHFARRQMTWFRRFKNVQWFESVVDVHKVLSYINST